MTLSKKKANLLNFDVQRRCKRKRTGWSTVPNSRMIISTCWSAYSLNAGKTVHKNMYICASAKRRPTHERFPWPKGNEAYGSVTLFSDVSRVHRSGQKRCGSTKYLGSRPLE